MEAHTDKIPGKEVSTTLEYTKELCETVSGFNCRHLLEAKEDGRKQP